MHNISLTIIHRPCIILGMFGYVDLEYSTTEPTFLLASCFSILEVKLFQYCFEGSTHFQIVDTGHRLYPMYLRVLNLFDIASVL